MWICLNYAMMIVWLIGFDFVLVILGCFRLGDCVLVVVSAS